MAHGLVTEDVFNESQPSGSQEGAVETSPVSVPLKESDQEKRVIYDKEDYRGRITIIEKNNKLSAAIRIIPPASGGDSYSSDDILYILSNLSITAEIQEKKIEEYIAAIGSESNLSEVTIVQGKLPSDGKDGICETLYDADEPYVDKNQKILRITEPEQGTGGEDIYGELVPSKPGRRPKVIAGEHVIEDEHGEFWSEIFGRVVFSDNNISVEKVLFVHVAANSMEAFLSYTGKSKLTAEKIREEIYSKNISSGIDDHAIDFIVSSFNESGTPIKEFLIAKGTPCKQGRDGEIKFLFSQSKGLGLNEYLQDGEIVQGINTIRSVEKDSEIACIIPHIEPSSGKDIYGRIISAQKVKKVKLRPGKNVRASEDGLHFFAESGGKPVLEGDKLSISDVLRISGDLDYTVGNIDFDGVVEIEGDVADGFQVKATKTIFIKGIVGAADLEAGLDIQILGGCNGLERSHITAGGNIEAKYMNEVFVKSQGDILVKNEIVSSHIYCLGRVYVKFGSIRGGEIGAKLGIESLDIGNDVAIKTTLIPGDDFVLNEELKRIDEIIVQKNTEMAEITKRISPLLKNKELLAKLPEDTQQKLKETLEYLKNLRNEKNALNQEKNNAISKALQDALPEVVVYHYIYSGVILKIGKSRRVISSVLEGPLRLFEEEDRVTVEPYSEKKKTRK